VGGSAGLTLDVIEASPALRKQRFAELAEAVADVLREPIERGFSGATATIEQTLAGIATVGDRGLAPRSPYGGQDRISGPTPAAGSSFVYQVTGSEIIYLRSAMCRLTTSSAAADREIVLEYQDGNGTRDVISGPNAPQQASQVTSFCWMPPVGLAYWQVADAVLSPLPQQYLFPSDQLVIRVQAMDVADQIDQVRIVVERFRLSELT
jgi:hypothetical protein